MKTLVLALFCLCSAVAFSQEVKTSNVPDVVLKEFKTIRPKANKVKWIKVEDGYRASFILKGVKSSVLIDEFGNWLDTRTNVPLNSLPDSVMIYMHKNYPGAIIGQTMKVVPISSLTFWYVKSGDHYYVFDEAGSYVRTDEEEKMADD